MWTHQILVMLQVIVYHQISNSLISQQSHNRRPNTNLNQNRKFDILECNSTTTITNVQTHSSEAVSRVSLLHSTIMPQAYCATQLLCLPLTQRSFIITTISHSSVFTYLKYYDLPSNLFYIH